MEKNEYKENLKKLAKKEILIESIIEWRKEKAIKKQIFKKIFKIAECLGNTTQGRIGQMITFQDTVLSLGVDADYYQIDINLNAMEHDYVFEGRSDVSLKRIDLYIPKMEWEEHLDYLYKKALTIEKVKELQQIRSKHDKLIKKWQITDEEWQKNEEELS